MPKERKERKERAGRLAVKERASKKAAEKLAKKPAKARSGKKPRKDRVRIVSMGIYEQRSGTPKQKRSSLIVRSEARNTDEGQEMQNEPQHKCTCGAVAVAKHMTFDFGAKPMTRKTLLRCGDCSKHWTVTETNPPPVISTTCPVTNYF